MQSPAENNRALLQALLGIQSILVSVLEERHPGIKHDIVVRLREFADTSAASGAPALGVALIRRFEAVLNAEMTRPAFQA